VLRVDGGASVSNFMMQFEADMLRKPIDRPQMVETTAFGAAFLAGLAAGVWSDISEIKDIRVSDRVFRPVMEEEKAREYYRMWLRAVERSEKWDVPDDEKSLQTC
jgi:glycerol kinase